MHVSSDHLQQLDQAIDTAEPLLLIPSLHPRYIQSLLGQWSAAAPRREVSLLEAYMGRQVVSQTGLRVSGGTDEGQDLSAWLLDHRPSAGDIADGWHHIWWLPELEASWSDPRTLAVVTSLCRRIAALGLPLHLAVREPSGTLPPALQAWARPVELLTPKASEDEQSSFALDVLRSDLPQLRAERAALEARLAELESHKLPARAELASMLQGLDAAAINIVIEAVARWSSARPTLEPEKAWKQLKGRLSQERARQLQRASGLTIEQPAGEALQGMPRFQRYLEYVSVLFHDRRFERKEGGPTPRGVLLVGLPGCGKSLAARVTAQKLEVPLLRLDVGGMMGRHLGESEANLSRALDAAEAAAPCVLWVDELEKALGGLGDSSEGGGTGKRMLGKLLTWMQEHDSSVYLFATANKVKDLPPELLRRGRFDELWRVMLPREDERAAILQAKLTELDSECAPSLRKPDSKGLKQLVKDTKGFTGADLTSLVREAWMRRRVFERPVDEGALQEVLKGDFQPMSAQFSDKIEEDVEALDKHGFRDVWCTAKELPPPPPADRTGKGGRLVGQLAELWRTSEPVLAVFKSATGKSWTMVVDPGEGSSRSAAMAKEPRSWAEWRLSSRGRITLERDGRAVAVRGLTKGKKKTPVCAQLCRVGEEPGALQLEVDGTVYVLEGSPRPEAMTLPPPLDAIWNASEPMAFAVSSDTSKQVIVVVVQPKGSGAPRSAEVHFGSGRVARFNRQPTRVTLTPVDVQLAIDGLKNRAGMPIHASLQARGGAIALAMDGSLLPQLVEVQPEVALFGEAPKTSPLGMPWFVWEGTRYTPYYDSSKKVVIAVDPNRRSIICSVKQATPELLILQTPYSTGGSRLSHKQLVWRSVPKEGSAGRLHVTSLDAYRHANNVELGGSWSSLANQVHLNG